MYLEFKDTFHYHDGTHILCRWNTAVNMLNDYIKQHIDEHVEVLFYNTVYLSDKHFSQTCILVRVGRLKK